MKNVLPRILLLCVFFAAISFNSIQAQNSIPYDWKNVAIGGGGYVTGIITSKEQPTLKYARTDVGGAYRWDVASNRWIPLMDWASENQQGMLGTEAIAIDPQSPNIVYMSQGISYFNSGRSYIIKSTDYGANFTITEVTSQFKIHGNGMGRQNGERLAVDPNNSNIIYCGTRANGLWKSTDAAATWTRVSGLDVTTTPNENGVCFVIPDKTSAAGGATQRIFAGISRTGNNQNFYKSEDGGATFAPVINPNVAAGHMPQRAVPDGAGNLVITYANGGGPYGTGSEPFDQGQIWKYNIGTGGWTNVTPGLNRAYGGIGVDPNNPMRMVASTINTYMLQYNNAYGDRIFYSTDGGTSWTDVVASGGFVLDPNGVSWINGHAIHWAGSIGFDPANTNRVLVTSGNGVFVNENIGVSNIWKFNVAGLEETVPLNLVSIPGGPVISVIGDYDGFRHTDVTQYAPIHTPRTGTTTGLDFAAANTNKVVRVGSSMYYSNDVGVTWTKTTAELNGARGQVALSADGNVILHCPENSSVTYRSVNNGSSWTPVTGLSIRSARPVADAVNANNFYAYSSNNDNGSIPNGMMMVSTDGGVSFAPTVNVGSWGSRIIRTVPGREGHLWVPLYNGGLARSINSATSFTNIANVTQCGAVGIGKAADGSNYETIYIWGTVAGVLGVHRSTDEGATWVRVNDDEHEYGGPANGQFVVGDMNVFGRVYMSTAGRGIVYGNPSTSLPVTLAALKGRVVNHNDEALTKLTWETFSETNNKEFLVERSFNSEDWERINSIASTAINGNSTQRLYYNYDDNITTYNGNIHYRLKQVDLDGQYRFSNIVTVKRRGNNKEMKVSVYPNPVVAGIVNVKINSLVDDRVQVRILNMSGVSVYRGKKVNTIAGDNLIPVNVTTLPKGVYVVEVRDKMNQVIGLMKVTR